MNKVREAPVWGECADWADGTYSYISGNRRFAVYDERLKSGGHDPLPYAGAHGILPSFRDGTLAQFGPCSQCHAYGPLMYVRAGIVGRKWRCAECCPQGSLPHL